MVYAELDRWRMQRVIRAYAAKLLGRLPKTATGGTSGTPTAHTTDWYARSVLVNHYLEVQCHAPRDCRVLVVLQIVQ